MEKIGVFGGTFNPVHNGHIHLVRQFDDSIPDSRIMIIPTNVPPHKRAVDLADGEDRLQMCRLAFEDFENVQISDMEIKRSGLSYTVDTLTRLKAKHPDSQLYFIIGSDMLQTFLTWYRPLDILSLATICAAARQEDIDDNMRHNVMEIEQKGGKVILLNAPVVEISSTQVRQTVKSGRPTDELIPERVYEYIKEHGLYL